MPSIVYCAMHAARSAFDQCINKNGCGNRHLCQLQLEYYEYVDTEGSLTHLKVLASLCAAPNYCIFILSASQNQFTTERVSFTHQCKQ